MQSPYYHPGLIKTKTIENNPKTIKSNPKTIEDLSELISELVYQYFGSPNNSIIKPKIKKVLKPKPIENFIDTDKAEAISKLVCRYFGLYNNHIIKTKTRKRLVVYMRRWSIVFIKLNTSMTHQEIAIFLRQAEYDHSDISHALIKIHEQINAKHSNDYKDDYPKLCAIMAKYNFANIVSDKLIKNGRA